MSGETWVLIDRTVVLTIRFLIIRVKFSENGMTIESGGGLDDWRKSVRKESLKYFCYYNTKSSILLGIYCVFLLV